MTPTTTDLGPLYAALLAAQRAACAVPLDGRTTHGERYRYASHEVILGEARSALLDHGLVLCPSAGAADVIDGEILDRRTGEVRTGAVLVRYDATYTLAHPESGAAIEIAAGSSANVRGGNVATAHVAAITYCLRELLRTLLLLPRGESADPEEAPPSRAPAAPKPKPKPKPAPKPKPKQAEVTPERSANAVRERLADHPPVTSSDLMSAGWDERDALELAAVPDDTIPAPVGLQRLVLSALVDAIGQTQTKDAFRAQGLETMQEWPATYGQLRRAALCRSAGSLPF